MDGATLRAWWQASRPPFFVATLIPLGLGGVLAAVEGAWRTDLWLAALLASFCVHLCTNLANDYFDWRAGADAGDSIGGSRVIQQGKIAPRRIVLALVLLYGLALLCGLWLLWTTRLWWLAAVMLLAGFSSLFYTAPPVRYGYRGLGELFVGLNMGPVMVGGTHGVLTGGLSASALLISLPVGILVALILFYQSLPDVAADAAVGKRTIAVRLGRRGCQHAYRAFVAAALGAVIALVAARLLPPAALACLLTVPLAVAVDHQIAETPDWIELHDRGGKVRLLYLANGIVLILAAALFRDSG